MEGPSHLDRWVNTYRLYLHMKAVHWCKIPIYLLKHFILIQLPRKSCDGTFHYPPQFTSRLFCSFHQYWRSHSAFLEIPSSSFSLPWLNELAMSGSRWTWERAGSHSFVPKEQYLHCCGPSLAGGTNDRTCSCTCLLQHTPSLVTVRVLARTAAAVLLTCADWPAGNSFHLCIIFTHL